MVPRIANRGTSFKGAGLYYLHDKEALTNERVAFTHTENVPTKDPEKALKWMAWTASHADELKAQNGIPATGAKMRKPVFAFSLAWHPEEKPEQWEMISAGRSALIALGLQEHESVFVAHRDERHPHLHLIVNAINPNTGKSNTLSYSKQKLSKWAEAYEVERGKIYCQQRVDNNEKRAREEYVRYQEPEGDLKDTIAQLYHSSDSGKAFRAALAERKLTLAKGRRIVVIDENGETHSLSRQLDGVRAKDICDRLKDLDLPTHKEQREESDGRKQKAPVYFDRDEQNRQQDERIIDAGIAHDQKTRATEQRRPPAPSRSELLNDLQDRKTAALDRASLEGQHVRARLDFTLENQYGLHERQLRRDASDIETALNDPSRSRRWWMGLTGHRARLRGELEDAQRSLATIEQRKEEAYGAYRLREDQRRAEIEARYADQVRAVEQCFGAKESEAHTQAPIAARLDDKQIRNVPGPTAPVKSLHPSEHFAVAAQASDPSYDARLEAYAARFDPSEQEYEEEADNRFDSVSLDPAVQQQRALQAQTMGLPPSFNNAASGGMTPETTEYQARLDAYAERVASQNQAQQSRPQPTQE
jgi:hypothetical protein